MPELSFFLFIGIEADEKVAAIAFVPKVEKGSFVVTLTKNGQIKKTEVDEYENFREKGIIGVKVDDGDHLLYAGLTDGTREFLIATKSGQCIRFPEEQVRPMGRATHGVKGIDLGDGDTYLTKLANYAVTNWLQTSAPVLDYANLPFIASKSPLRDVGI